MMKSPFKVSDSACFIKLYKHDFEVMKYIGYIMPTHGLYITPWLSVIIINLI